MKADERKVLLQARHWMGELHGWYWSRKETHRDGPQMKALIEDIKRVDELLEREKQGS